MTYIGQKTRKAQNSIQIYHCISNTINKAEHLNIVGGISQMYSARNTYGWATVQIQIQKSVTDTRATSYHLSEILTNIETYITMVNSNILIFNQHVKFNVEGLKSMG